MQTLWKRAHNLIYLGILQVLLVGFAVHGMHHHARIPRPHAPHRSARAGSRTRTEEASASESAWGDRWTSDHASTLPKQDHPRLSLVSPAALPAVPVRLSLPDDFVQLPRGNIAAYVPFSELSSIYPRGPPALFSLL